MGIIGRGGGGGGGGGAGGEQALGGDGAGGITGRGAGGGGSGSIGGGVGVSMGGGGGGGSVSRPVLALLPRVGVLDTDPTRGVLEKIKDKKAVSNNAEINLLFPHFRFIFSACVQK